MGVSGATKNIIGYKPNKINLRNLTNYSDHNKKKVVIDAHSVMNRYVIGSFNTEKYVVDMYDNKIMEIYYLLIIAIRFISIDILPIFVFDGRSPDIKADTIERRRQSKDKAEEILENLNVNTKTQDDTTSVLTDINEQNLNEVIDSDIIKYLKRSYRPDITNVQLAKLLLGHMGIPVIDAPGEADPQCAAIASVNSDVIGVITDDFDALMFSSPNILRMTSLGNNTLDEYSMKNTLSHLQNKMNHIINNSSDAHLKIIYSTKQIEITYENLREICCLMGTDYCPGLKLKSNGKDKFDHLLEMYILNDMSLEKVLQSMSNILSKNYITRMMESLDAYKNAEVFDPRELKISMNKPSIDNVRNICSEFLKPVDVEEICNLLTKMYGDFSQNILAFKSRSNCSKPNCSKSNFNQNDGFGSFASYKMRYAREQKRLYGLKTDNIRLKTDNINFVELNHDKSFVAFNKSWPDAMYLIPITNDS